MEEIDLVAEVLTGNRQHFWLKPLFNAGLAKATTTAAGQQKRDS
jgi:hypothetical protein